MAERNITFWNSVELNAPSLSHWYLQEKDFGMGGSLDNVLERNVGCNLVIVGPLLDGFINRIGKGFTNKLARSKLTGMQHLQSIFFPWQICIRFVRGYGCYYYSKREKEKEYYYNFSKSRCNSKDMTPT